MKITQKQFKIFRSEVEKWIDFFGLKDWQALFLFEKLKDNRAEIRYNCVSGIAVFVLNTEWNELDISWVNDESIKKAGFHEVCELLLGRLVDMADQRYDVTEAGIEEEKHRIIRILENVLWEIHLKL
jgi:hypothetical protein